MRFYATLIGILAIGSLTGVAQDAPKDGGKKEGPKRVVLLRFRDKTLKEHVYTCGNDEPAAWRQNADMEGETAIGQVAITKEPDTTRLFRSVRSNKKHHFYLQVPTAARDATLEDFMVYVWTKAGDGRIPVHGCLLPDATDFYMDTDQKQVANYTDESLKGTGAKRISVARYFYVYPPPKADAKEAAKQ